MRKRKVGRKLSRETGQRKALIRTMATSLFLKEKIETTEAKAKELSQFSDKIITRAKLGDLATMRFLSSLFCIRVARKVFKDIAKRYQTRNGGYTRVVKTGPRKSDGARMAIIELVK